jgi:hypothetical protein
VKIMRKIRRLNRRARRITIAAVTAAVVSTLGGCDLTPDGEILEVETGRNGVKAEIRDGDGDYEVYLVRDTTCRPGDQITDCADRDDYLTEPVGHTPGLNTDGND